MEIKADYLEAKEIWNWTRGAAEKLLLSLVNFLIMVAKTVY